MHRQTLFAADKIVIFSEIIAVLLHHRCTSAKAPLLQCHWTTVPVLLHCYRAAAPALHQCCAGGISGFSVCIESVSWLFQLASLSFSKGMPSCEAYWKLWTFSACKSNFQQSATPTFYHRNSLSDMKQQDDTCTTKRC